tara:strand:- start:2398 stop:5010 length:2613 start_codon:yes stop_codon:yes gene_type:complete
MKMKNIYKLFSSIFVLLLFVGCEDDFSDTTDFANVAPPSNISASFEVTQDNTGLVTITPSGEGSISFVIDYGDGSELSPSINNGGNIQHTYKEGSYTVKVTATGLNGLTAVGEVPLTVSFKAPENLVLTITNDEVKSKKVNVTLTADFATMYEYYPGVDGVDPVTANIGESLSYQYAEAGIYTVRVVAKGGAIETTELTQDFEVTAILQPTVSAPAQPDRPAATVVSVYSNKYQDINGVNFYPNWGQTTQFAEYDLNGDKMLQYSTVNYQGIELGGNYDLSSFEYMHVDVWTASPEFENLEISLISPSNGEKPVLGKLDQDKWTSLDIPLSEWTNQGLTIADIFQLKLAINPWNPSGAGTIFLDNIYFWKENSVELPINFDNEEKFEGKGGFQFALSTDPDDSSNNTGKITTSTEWWDTAEITLDVPIEIVKGADNNVSVRFYSPNDDKHRLLMKLENKDDPNGSEYLEISHEVSSKGWHDLTYDWSTKTTQNYPNDGQPFDGTGSFERLVFFIDAGSPDWCGDCGPTFGQTLDFHIDNIIKGLPPDPLYPLFDDFEGNGSITWAADAVGMNVIDNPHGSGKVLKYEDTGGDYANVRFDLKADHSAKFDLSTNNIFKFKIYIPSAELTGNLDNKVELKLQDGSKDRPWEGQHGVSTMLELDKWNNVYIDFSEKASSTEFSRIVLQVNGEGNNDKVTAYIDDFYYEVPQSHDDFEGNGNIALWEKELEDMQIIDNPVKGTINSSDKVLVYHDQGGQQYANIRYYLASDNSISFDLTNANKITLDVYMPSSDLTGTQVNKLWLKLQNGNKDRPWEGQITAEQAVELDKWQRLTFDFSDQSSATEFTRMLVQFNGEDNFDSVKAYIDNVFIHR